LRDHDGERLPDIAHFVLGDDVLAVRFHLGQGRKTNRDLGDVAVVPQHICRGIDRDHARHALRLEEVDALQPAMGNRAPYDGSVQHPGQVDVVDITAVADQQAGVFHPLHRQADHLLLGAHASPFSRP
jgi:hypothetical protein